MHVKKLNFCDTVVTVSNVKPCKEHPDLANIYWFKVAIKTLDRGVKYVQS